MTKCDIIKMNNVNKIKANIPNMEIETELGKLIDTLATRVEKEVHGAGYFRDIVVKFDIANKPKDLFAKNIALIVEPNTNEKGKAILSVAGLHPHMLKESTIYLTTGNRNQLIEYLKKDNIKDELIKSIQQVEDALKKM